MERAVCHGDEFGEGERGNVAATAKAKGVNGGEGGEGKREVSGMGRFKVAEEVLESGAVLETREGLVIKLLSRAGSRGVARELGGSARCR